MLSFFKKKHKKNQTQNDRNNNTTDNNVRRYPFGNVFEPVYYNCNLNDDPYENSPNIDNFQEVLEQEQQAVIDAINNQKDKDDLTNANLYPENFINTLGNDIGSDFGYNLAKSHLNTFYLSNRVSDNFILTLQPFLIDKFVKTNIIFKKVASIPIMDAMTGLSIKSTDARIDEETTDRINGFIKTNLLKIINCLIDAELYGASFIVLTGDNNRLRQPISAVKRDVNINIFDIRECKLNAKQITDLKSNIHTNSTISVCNKAIHQSRCVLLCGSNIPNGYLYKHLMRGLSFSVFENLRSPLYGIILAIESGDEMVLKQSLDVLGYKGLTAKLSDVKATRSVMKSLSGFIKFVLQKLRSDDVIVMDADNKYERLSNNFNLSVLIEGIAKEYAFYTGIPSSRLLGETSGNLAGTNINANERAYTQILSQKQQHYYGYLHILLEKIIYMKYGIEEAEFDIVFEPQKEITESEQLDNQLKKVQIYQVAQQTGAMSVEEIREALRQDGILSEPVEEGDIDVLEDNDNLITEQLGSFFNTNNNENDTQ